MDIIVKDLLIIDHNAILETVYQTVINVEISMVMYGLFAKLMKKIYLSHNLT